MSDVIGETSMGAALVCLGVLVRLLGGRHCGMRRARLLLAGGGVVATGPPVWERVLAELRRRRGQGEPSGGRSSPDWRSPCWAPR